MLKRKLIAPFRLGAKPSNRLAYSWGHKKIAVNLKEIPTQNSKENSMARCWKMREYDRKVGVMCSRPGQ